MGLNETFFLINGDVHINSGYIKRVVKFENIFGKYLFYIIRARHVLSYHLIPLSTMIKTVSDQIKTQFHCTDTIYDFDPKQGLDRALQN